MENRDIQIYSQGNAHYSDDSGLNWTLQPSQVTSIAGMQSVLSEVSSTYGQRVRWRVISNATFGRTKWIYGPLQPNEQHYKKRTSRTNPYNHITYGFGSIPFGKDSGRWYRTDVVGTDMPLLDAYYNFYDEYLQETADRCEAKNYSKFMEKLKGTQVDLTIAVAEGAKTRLMIKSRVVLLLKATAWITGFVKRQKYLIFKYGMSPAKALANAWLEWNYGWKQLANDIYGISQFQGVAAGHRNVKARSSQTKERTVIYDVYKPYSGLISTNTVKYSVRVERNVELFAVAHGAVDFAALASLNPLAIAWELVPFSFVFDWLFDLSSMLSNLQASALIGYDFHSGYHTTVYRIECTSHVRSGVFAGSSLWYDIRTPIIQKSTYTFKKRRKMTQFDLVPSFPPINSPLSASHALTTLSLIVQKLSRKALGR